MLIMQVLRKTALASAVFMLITAASPAQEMDCSTRTLPVSVRDAQGVPIHGLLPSDFEAKIRGKPAQILSITPDSRPHRVVILLDTSGSMAGDMFSRRWQMVSTLALDAASASGPETQAALLLFAGRTVERHDFSVGKAVITQRLKQIASDPKVPKSGIRGHTAIYDAISAGYQLLDHPGPADTLYVITDGYDNESHARPSEVESLLLRSRVRLFAAVIQEASSGTFRIRPGAGVRSPEELARVAERTGGVMINLRELSPIENRWIVAGVDEDTPMQQVMDNLYRAMLEEDLVEIQMPLDLRGRERLRLMLSAEQRKKWKGGNVLVPAEIEPCTTTKSH
jgi:VWFA-related protein